jgi:hypothetical protein
MRPVVAGTPRHQPRSGDQTEVAELVAKVASLGCVPPGAAQCGLVGENAEKAEVTLSRIMNSGKDTVHDERLK